MAASMLAAAARAAQVAAGVSGIKGSDSRFFATTKKGELHELKEELNSPKMPVKRDAIKKVIAAMTVGKDVSSLFPDMINSMQTGNLELKKLVYLYVINYSKSQPDLVIMGVNTFRRDANDPNPLIRALAIRTMGCVRVDKIVEYLCEPLRRSLRDEDPYVRKTAALCVAKLNDLDPELCEEQGFVEMLRDLVSDANPAVVANAVAALSEISQDAANPQEVFQVTSAVLQKLLAALNECTEWGQVFILDALGGYEAHDSSEAESIIERVSPRLQHSNAAVVMGAVKVIVRYLDVVADTDARRQLTKKLAPPLVTLISSNVPEIQYVALRNIQLIIASRPEILHKDIRVFFCKFNDPLYVKMEKLEVLIQLVREQSADQVLGELKEYASEVDVEFVRRAVRAIGRTAIKLERSAERCVNVLIELIQTRVSYVVQEAVVTIKDIFRRYPNRYESVIAVLCENLESLDEPMAKASMVWIVGENADRIDNASDLLETFVDTFFDEVAEVQLQLLTATVKLFLVKPQSRALMERVLKLATEESDNPDLRDRAFIYWRLLATDPETARAVVMGEKPVIEDDSAKIDEGLLLELLEHVSSLASVYHKPPRAFVKKIVRPVASRDDAGEGDEDEPPIRTFSVNNNNNNAATTPTADPGNLLDLDASFGASSSSSSSKGLAKNEVPNLPVLLDGHDAKAGGLGVAGTFRRVDGGVSLELMLSNTSSGEDLGDRFAVKFNKNTFALTPAKASFSVDTPLAPGGAPGVAMVPCKVDPNNANKGVAPNLVVEMALKVSKTGNVVYFNAALPFHVLFVEGPPSVQNADAAWASAESLHTVQDSVKARWPADVAGALAPHNILSLGGMFFSLKTSTGANCMVRIAQPVVEVRCAQRGVLPFVLQALIELITEAGSSSSAATSSSSSSNTDLLGGLWSSAGTTTSAPSSSRGAMDLMGLDMGGMGMGAPQVAAKPTNNSADLLELF